MPVTEPVWPCKVSPLLPTRHVPQPHGRTHVGACQETTIRREGHHAERIGVPCKGGLLL